MNQDFSLSKRVEMALEQLRPYLIADGGNVILAGITKDNVVQLKLTGNCSNCTMSDMTLKAGLEQAILKAVPEISSVVALGEEGPEALKIKKGLS